MSSPDAPPDEPMPAAEAAPPAEAASPAAPEAAQRMYLRNGLALAATAAAVFLLIDGGHALYLRLTEGYPKGPPFDYTLVRRQWDADWAGAAAISAVAWLVSAEFWRRGKWIVAGALSALALVALCTGIPDK